MGPKKSRKADLQIRKKLFFEIGLVSSLAFAISIFSCAQEERTIEEFDSGYVVTDTELTEVTVSDSDPVTKTRTIAVHSNVINIVDNDRQINNEFNDWTDFGEDIRIEPIERRERPVAENDIFVAVEQMPSFRGGDLADFQRWVQSNVKYPSLAAENRMQGKVIVEFVVRKDGTVGNISVLQSPDTSLAEEVIRVLRESPEWQAGRQGRTPVNVRFTLPVQFVLK